MTLAHHTPDSPTGFRTPAAALVAASLDDQRRGGAHLGRLTATNGIKPDHPSLIAIGREIVSAVAPQARGGMAEWLRRRSAGYFDWGFYVMRRSAGDHDEIFTVSP